MKNCPNQKCNSKDVFCGSYQADPNTGEQYFGVHCDCGLSGPCVDSMEEAIELWDALPRMEDTTELLGEIKGLRTVISNYMGFIRELKDEKLQMQEDIQKLQDRIDRVLEYVDARKEVATAEESLTLEFVKEVLSKD